MAPLTVPLCFSSRETSPLEISPNSVEASFSATTPSSIIQWGPPLTEDIDRSKIDDALVRQGVAVGCDDGTVYIFEPSAKIRHLERLPSGSVLHLDVRSSSSQSTSPRHLGISAGSSKSRSASPSSVKSGYSPFQVTRSRIVSSVTNEQVEAPKVYVDYDEEPEKLKNFLKGKGISREKQALETSSSDASHQDLCQVRPPRNVSNGSMTSSETTLSPSSSIKHSPLSPSPYPQASAGQQDPRSFYPLSLKYHMFPPSCARGQPSILKQYDAGRFFACLQQTG